MQLFTRGCDFHALMSNGGPKINLILEMLKAVIGLSEHTIPALLFASVAKFDPNFDESNFELLEKLKKKFYNMLGSNGILLFPSGRNVAPNLAETYVDGYSFIYTCFFNALGVPVTQCPLGINKDGLPLGVQVVGAPYNDHLTLAVAKELENAFGGWVPPCQIKF
ncbi:fatty-acid amide hydrolase 2-like protein [Leptotrombidium deliense]|uniref:Fatty-acid amide hydrolase 2-like protein n=1 Tax=Leptotrombidium deliense TaxID=299467 RepID=A0A443RT30_9ACAR|nr:fatty-acid amide hydrolase 2-like protein [Leptotrombidium deliense]